MKNNPNNRNILKMSSQFIKGVGPSRQLLLQRLGIETVEDLLMHYPRGYYDRSNMTKICDIEVESEATFAGIVLVVSLRKLRGGRTILKVAVGDETGRIDLVFFNQPFLKKMFRQGRKIIVSGTVNLYRGVKQISAPDFEFYSDDPDGGFIHTNRIVPVYPLTSGISQRMMRIIIKAALEKAKGRIEENIPEPLRDSLKFIGRQEALQQIHYPETFQDLDEAVRRLKFEEVFFIHLLLKMRRKKICENNPRPKISPPYGLLKKFLKSLPFRLTEAQKKVLHEIRGDVENSRGMGRLLQGDVGSGKTIVGLASMIMAVDNGYQTAMMVPTEILARQHYKKIKEYLKDLPINVELLIGALKKQEKERLYSELERGSIDIIIGTQALIQEGISFKQIGLAIIDEQHRFGVKQRASLGKKNELPHFLVMTATPIPRSLAQIVYGDLKLSVIDSFPFGTREVKTELVKEERKSDCYSFARKLFREGGQAFIVYPVVEDSDRSDLKAATAEFERLQRDLFKDFPIGLLHGRMSFEEKSKAVDMFVNGEIAALITTTVIEVGVDIPNASMLIVNNPERFGLAQLHQLRGRIGREGRKGVCFLITGENIGKKSLDRLEFFAETNDGFAVAEKDLQIRGPGEIWGFRQSGYPLFRLINPISDNMIVKCSWEESDKLLEIDPHLNKPENRVVEKYFRLYYKERMEIAEIG